MLAKAFEIRVLCKLIEIGKKVGVWIQHTKVFSSNPAPAIIMKSRG